MCARVSTCVCSHRIHSLVRLLLARRQATVPHDLIACVSFAIALLSLMLLSAHRCRCQLIDADVSTLASRHRVHDIFSVHDFQSPSLSPSLVPATQECLLVSDLKLDSTPPSSLTRKISLAYSQNHVTIRLKDAGEFQVRLHSFPPDITAHGCRTGSLMPTRTSALSPTSDTSDL